MNKLNIHATAYDDVNSFLQVFLDNVRSALRNDLIGMYLSKIHHLIERALISMISFNYKSKENGLGSNI